MAPAAAASAAPRRPRSDPEPSANGTAPSPQASAVTSAAAATVNAFTSTSPPLHGPRGRETVLSRVACPPGRGRVELRLLLDGRLAELLGALGDDLAELEPVGLLQREDLAREGEGDLDDVLRRREDLGGAGVRDQADSDLGGTQRDVLRLLQRRDRGL